MDVITDMEQDVRAVWDRFYFDRFVSAPVIPGGDARIYSARYAANVWGVVEPGTFDGDEPGPIKIEVAVCSFRHVGKAGEGKFWHGLIVS